MYRIFAWIAVLVFLSGAASAGDLGFESTSQGMIEALTKPRSKETPPSRSWTPLADPDKRGIKVIRKEEGKTVEEWRPIAETQQAPSLNLKVEFDVNSSAIRPDSFALLKELGEALTSEQLHDRTVTIKGHTDSDGSEAYNLTLSMNRAQAVKDYLVSHFHIPGDQLQVIGYGESLPLVPNTSAVNKQLNRRVEIEAGL